MSRVLHFMSFFQPYPQAYINFRFPTYLMQVQVRLQSQQAILILLPQSNEICGTYRSRKPVIYSNKISKTMYQVLHV